MKTKSELPSDTTVRSRFTYDMPSNFSRLLERYSKFSKEKCYVAGGEYFIARVSAQHESWSVEASVLTS